jgi:hypothetical protein
MPLSPWMRLAGSFFWTALSSAQSAWSGAAGATASTEPLQIGRYYNYPTRFQGAIDEVTIWNRALAASEVQSFKNIPLTGQENGLVACWHLNEGSGTNTADATGLGHAGILTNGPAWTCSTAFLGDSTSTIQTTLGAAQWSRSFAVKTIPSERGFTATAPFWVRRLDDFGAPGGTANVIVNLQSLLQGTLAGPVALVNNSAQFSLGLSPFLAAAPQTTAGGVIQSPTLNLEPQAGIQLDSVNDTFQLGVTETYTVNGGPTLNADAITLAPTPLLHFDGNLLFGSFTTVFTSLANNPTRGAPGGGGINTILAVNNNSGYLVAKPDHTYGNGSLLNVVLLSNGDAISSSSVTLNGPVPDIECIQNICFQRTSLNLTPTGASGFLAMTLPAGFSIGISPTNHFTVGALEYANTPLDQNLHPTSSSLVTSGPLYAIQETLPFWFTAPSVTWQVNSGAIVLNPTGGGSGALGEVRSTDVAPTERARRDRTVTEQSAVGSKTKLVGGVGCERERGGDRCERHPQGTRSDARCDRFERTFANATRGCARLFRSGSGTSSRSPGEEHALSATRGDVADQIPRRRF